MGISRKEVTKRVRIADIDERWRELDTQEKQAVREEVGILIVDKINSFLDRSSTPVSGGGYKKNKKDGKPSKLFEEGDMRSQITFLEFRDGVDVGVFEDAPKKELDKAYNHNTGDTLPQRQFIPEKDQEFKSEIKDGIREIVSKYMD